MKIQQNILPLNLRKYTLGLQTLKETNVTVENLQQTITQYQPILEKNQKENQELLIVLDANTKEAKETELFVLRETNEAQIKKDEVNTLKEQC
jgi:dynein heavy chain, axonemal